MSFFYICIDRKDIKYPSLDKEWQNVEMRIQH
jgi:hypothetical protein